MCDDHTPWQLISRNADDIFGTIRGDATWLSTTELLTIYGNSMDQRRFASYLFSKYGNKVLKRYKSKAEAIQGHERLAKKFNLR